jgi:hypothetical protein
VCKGRVGRLRAGGWRQEATILGFARGCRGTDLPNYLNEFQFRWNTRKMDDGQRVARAIKQIDGKRLEYRGVGRESAVSAETASTDGGTSK